jgi:hypothetical protein
LSPDLIGKTQRPQRFDLHAFRYAALHRY